MKRCINSSRRTIQAVIATAALTVSGSVFAQSATVDDVLKATDERLNLARQSQERINEVVEGTRSIEDQYRAINKEVDGLRVYNRLMTAQTQGQEAVLEDIALSLEQVDMINRQIFPLMTRMIDGLKQSIALASVKTPWAEPGRELRLEHTVEFERRDVAATVVETPFFDPPRKKKP